MNGWKLGGAYLGQEAKCAPVHSRMRHAIQTADPHLDALRQTPTIHTPAHQRRVQTKSNAVLAGRAQGLPRVFHSSSPTPRMKTRVMTERQDVGLLRKTMIDTNGQRVASCRKAVADVSHMTSE